MGRGPMEEMLIIPRAEAPELVQKLSAMLMEDGRLSHAARLAARQERGRRTGETGRQAITSSGQETTSIANATFDGRRRGARRTRIVNPGFE